MYCPGADRVFIWMIVEPIAGRSPKENMNPVGRLYYNASTMIYVPTSLDQEVGEALGAQAGEEKLSEIIGRTARRAVAPCTSRRWIEPPRSRASEAHRGCAGHPRAGCRHSSARSAPSARHQSGAALRDCETSSASSCETQRDATE